MGSTSFFRDRYMKKIRQGVDKALFTIESYLTPGYYGPRGMDMMTVALTTTFGSLLQTQAQSDNHRRMDPQA